MALSSRNRSERRPSQPPAWYVRGGSLDVSRKEKGALEVDGSKGTPCDSFLVGQVPD